MYQTDEEKAAALLPAWLLPPACPKCGGQYLREGVECRCFQCSFRWDLREPLARVLERVRYYAQAKPEPAPGVWPEESWA